MNKEEILKLLVTSGMSQEEAETYYKSLEGLNESEITTKLSEVGIKPNGSQEGDDAVNQAQGTSNSGSGGSIGTNGGGTLSTNEKAKESNITNSTGDDIDSVAEKDSAVSFTDKFDQDPGKLAEITETFDPTTVDGQLPRNGALITQVNQFDDIIRDRRQRKSQPASNAERGIVDVNKVSVEQILLLNRRSAGQDFDLPETIEQSETLYMEKIGFKFDDEVTYPNGSDAFPESFDDFADSIGVDTGVTEWIDDTIESDHLTEMKAAWPAFVPNGSSDNLGEQETDAIAVIDKFTTYQSASDKYNPLNHKVEGRKEFVLHVPNSTGLYAVTGQDDMVAEYNLPTANPEALERGRAIYQHHKKLKQEHSRFQNNVEKSPLALISTEQYNRDIEIVSTILPMLSAMMYRVLMKMQYAKEHKARTGLFPQVDTLDQKTLKAYVPGLLRSADAFINSNLHFNKIRRAIAKANDILRHVPGDQLVLDAIKPALDPHKTDKDNQFNHPVIVEPVTHIAAAKYLLGETIHEDGSVDGTTFHTDLRIDGAGYDYEISTFGHIIQEAVNKYVNTPSDQGLPADKAFVPEIEFKSSIYHVTQSDLFWTYYLPGILNEVESSLRSYKYLWKTPESNGTQPELPAFLRTTGATGIQTDEVRGDEKDLVLSTKNDRLIHYLNTMPEVVQTTTVAGLDLSDGLIGSHKPVIFKNMSVAATSLDIDGIQKLRLVLDLPMDSAPTSSDDLASRIRSGEIFGVLPNNFEEMFITSNGSRVVSTRTATFIADGFVNTYLRSIKPAFGQVEPFYDYIDVEHTNSVIPVGLQVLSPAYSKAMDGENDPSAVDTWLDFTGDLSKDDSNNISFHAATGVPLTQSQVTNTTDTVESSVPGADRVTYKTGRTAVQRWMKNLPFKLFPTAPKAGTGFRIADLFEAERYLYPQFIIADDLMKEIFEEAEKKAYNIV